MYTELYTEYISLHGAVYWNTSPYADLDEDYISFSDSNRLQVESTRVALEGKLTNTQFEEQLHFERLITPLDAFLIDFNLSATSSRLTVKIFIYMDVDFCLKPPVPLTML